MDSQRLSLPKLIVWLTINTTACLFAFIFFFWVACNMIMPIFLVHACDTYLPWLLPIFNIPYIEIDSSIVGKLIFNAFLYAIFAVTHTLFSQEWLQEKLNRSLFPEPAIRTIFCLWSGLSAYMVTSCWQRTHIQLWNWFPSTMNEQSQQTILLLMFSGLFSFGWYALYKVDLLEIFGVRQLLNAYSHDQSATSIGSKSWTSGTKQLISNGLFGICRHPFYLSMLLAMAVTPSMSLDRCAFVIFTSTYLYFGIPIEERKLINKFGHAYVEYRKAVPTIIPSICSSKKSQDKSKSN